MPDDQSAVLDLYKMMVEMADRTSARRSGANSYFVTVNAALVTFIGVLATAHTLPKPADAPKLDTFGLTAASIAGIILALTWWALIRYYRRLNKAKFDVILALEEQLPEQPFTKEWKILQPDETKAQREKPTRSWRTWLKRYRHREASIVEQIVPIVFAAIYVVILIRVNCLR